MLVEPATEKRKETEKKAGVGRQKDKLTIFKFKQLFLLVRFFSLQHLELQQQRVSKQIQRSNHPHSCSNSRLLLPLTSSSTLSLATSQFFLFKSYTSHFFYKLLQRYCPSGISPIGNPGCLPQGKPAATELRYPTHCACWVF